MKTSKFFGFFVAFRSRKKGSVFRKALLAVSLLLCSYFLFVCVNAEDSFEQMPDGFSEMRDIMPDEIVEKMPDGVASDDAFEMGEALVEMTAPEYLLSLFSDIVGTELFGASKLFICICALLIISSAMNAVRATLSSNTLGTALRFFAVGAVMAVIVGVQLEQLNGVREYFDRLTSLMNAMIPVGGAVLAMGGNISGAASGSATLAVFIGVCETLCAKTILPVTCACTALSVCNTLTPDVGLKGFASALRKTYTFILGTIMTLLISSLSSQTALTSASDSTGARAAKLASSAAIPIVGGTVGDTLRTVAGGVSYLKSVVGVGAVFFIVLLLLPVLVALILSRLVFLLTGGVADMLGCETEGKLLSELGGIWGTMIAVVAMSSVMFIFALVIFIRISVAAG